MCMCIYSPLYRLNGAHLQDKWGICGGKEKCPVKDCFILNNVWWRKYVVQGRSMN